MFDQILSYAKELVPDKLEEVVSARWPQRNRNLAEMDPPDSVPHAGNGSSEPGARQDSRPHRSLKHELAEYSFSMRGDVVMVNPAEAHHLHEFKDDNHLPASVGYIATSQNPLRAPEPPAAEIATGAAYYTARGSDFSKAVSSRSPLKPGQIVRSSAVSKGLVWPFRVISGVGIFTSAKPVSGALEYVGASLASGTVATAAAGGAFAGTANPVAAGVAGAGAAAATFPTARIALRGALSLGEEIRMPLLDFRHHPLTLVNNGTRLLQRGGSKILGKHPEAPPLWNTPAEEIPTRFFTGEDGISLFEVSRKNHLRTEANLKLLKELEASIRGESSDLPAPKLDPVELEKSYHAVRIAIEKLREESLLALRYSDVHTEEERSQLPPEIHRLATGAQVALVERLVETHADLAFGLEEKLRRGEIPSRYELALLHEASDAKLVGLFSLSNLPGENREISPEMRELHKIADASDLRTSVISLYLNSSERIEEMARIVTEAPVESRPELLRQFAIRESQEGRPFPQHEAAQFGNSTQTLRLLQGFFDDEASYWSNLTRATEGPWPKGGPSSGGLEWLVERRLSQREIQRTWDKVRDLLSE